MEPTVQPLDETGNESDGNVVSDTADAIVDRHPWIQSLTQWGWVAKSVVYVLMGYTAIQVAQRKPVNDDASPEGSIGVIADAPLGRVVLGILAIGLLLYVAWRSISVAVITGTGLDSWGDRIGYSFSAIFYVTLAYSAGKAAITGLEPQESSTVEDLSVSVMDVTAGRTLVGLAGLVAIGVGVYFAIHKGVQRSFTDELVGVDKHLRDNEPKRQALLIAGVVGWLCRGLITMLVGYFVVRAAWRFDPNEARGFDQAFRAVSQSDLGGALVIASGLGLIAYGLFCLASARFRRLDDLDHE